MEGSTTESDDGQTKVGQRIARWDIRSEDAVDAIDSESDERQVAESVVELGDQSSVGVILFTPTVSLVAI